MKKIYSSYDFKVRNLKRSKNAIENKKKRKKRRYSNQFYSKNAFSNNSPYFNSTQKPKIIVKQAPSNFSFLENCDLMLEYLRDVHIELKKGKRILFDISKIKKLTTDAIAVLVAKLQDRGFTMAQEVYGNEPDQEDLRKLFTQSGFFEHVKTEVFVPRNNKKILIHKETNNRVEPDIAKEACMLGLEHIYGNNEIFEPLYEVLIEVMQNTNNHAGEVRGKYNWWLHVYNHPEIKKTSYTFLDLGFGIFESLPVRTFKRNLLELIGFASNLDLVEKLFAGEIKSRTARPERGKGIPQVYECSQNPTFSTFVLISNDVFADLKKNEYRLLSNKFNGTLFYWEINNEY